MNESALSVQVYKYNSAAPWAMVIYGICFFWFLYSIPSLGKQEIYLFGGALLFIPLYIGLTKTPVLKLRVWDERRLIFSGNTLEFGDQVYPVRDLQEVTIYLEAFKGFEYREKSTRPYDLYVNSSGDKNTISFRHRNGVIYLTFLLADYTQFFALRNILGGWVSQGVPVTVAQVFDDHFMIGEMAYHGTPGIPVE
jgi:hypothetical protein